MLDRLGAALAAAAASPAGAAAFWAAVATGLSTYFSTMFPVLAPTPRALQPLLSGQVPVHALPRLAAAAICDEPLAVARLAVAASAWLFILANITAHYYFTVTELPGSPCAGLSSSGAEQRLGPGSSEWWLSARKRAVRASPRSLRACPDPVVVPSKQIKLLQATETTALHWAEPLCAPTRPVSRTSVPSVASAALTSLTDDSSSFLQSSPQTPEPLLPQLSSPCQSSSPRVIRQAEDATPQPVRDEPMPDSDDTSCLEAPKLVKKGHRLTQSTSALPPPRRNSQILIAPTARAGAIHHMPTQSDTGYMSKSYSMVSAPSTTGLRSLSPAPLRPASAHPAVLIESHPHDPELDDLDSDDFFPLAKMCHKCPKVPLFKALAALPPELRLMERALRNQDPWPRHPTSALDAFEPEWAQPDQGQESDPDELDNVPDSALSPEADETEAGIIAWLGEAQAWQLVPPPKPERTHHCSVCNTCVFKYDQHCYWLNCCIGLGNERSYVLLLIWSALATLLISLTGLPVVRLAWDSLSPEIDWPFAVPRACAVLTWLVSVGLALILATTTLRQVHLVARGETRVESHENQYYAQLAWRRRQRFQNVYHLGAAQNLRLFFGTLADDELNSSTSAPMARSPSSAGGVAYLGSHQRGAYARVSDSPGHATARPDDPWKIGRIFWPCRVPPYSDGWHWAKRRGLSGRHAGIEVDEELNDAEDAAIDAYSPY